jgi:hypothetical protein
MSAGQALAANQNQEEKHCNAPAIFLPHLVVFASRRGNEHRLRVTGPAATTVPLRNDCWTSIAASTFHLQPKKCLVLVVVDVC